MSSSAIRTRSSSSPSPASSTSSAQSARDARRILGRRILLRRHQGAGQARAQRPRPRSGVERAPGLRSPPRRPHHVLQQQGVRARRRHQKHAQLGRRDFRSRCERRSQRPGDRPCTRRVPQSRQAGELYRGPDAGAQPRRAEFHLQAVCPLWPDQRAPRRWRPRRPAGGALARRSSPPGELRGASTTCWRR